jgi:hypothetical protein
MSQERNSLMGWLVLLLVFSLGAVTGAAMDGIYRANAVSGAPIKVESSEYFSVLKRDLELNAEQSSAVYSILDQVRSEYKGVCAQVRPQYETLRENGRARVRAILTPEQQKRFDLILLKEECCPYQK